MSYFSAHKSDESNLYILVAASLSGCSVMTAGPTAPSSQRRRRCYESRPPPDLDSTCSYPVSLRPAPETGLPKMKISDTGWNKQKNGGTAPAGCCAAHARQPWRGRPCGGQRGQRGGLLHLPARYQALHRRWVDVLLLCEMWLWRRRWLLQVITREATFLVGSDRPRVTFYKSLLTGFRKLKP